MYVCIYMHAYMPHGLGLFYVARGFGEAVDDNTTGYLELLKRVLEFDFLGLEHQALRRHQLACHLLDSSACPCM